MKNYKRLSVIDLTKDIALFDQKRLHVVDLK